jgi:hypothetical protein
VVARVRNVAVRIPGTAGGPAILLATHYDSVPTAPGASDDGHSVAALIETARALKSSPPLHRDTILLFTDGEELGLLGARAFADSHPWRGDIGLAINFEARGVTGPSLMFETSAGNLSLAREFARSAPDPLATSASYEIYRRMPNDTDFTVFRKAGWPGFNFAFIGGGVHYHTALDDPAHLDRRSLQHAGDAALALARYFGAMDVLPLRDGDAVYFNLPALGLVVYPAAWSAPLAVTLALLWIGAMILSLRRRSATGKSLLAGLAAALAIAVLAAAAVWAVWRAAQPFQPAWQALLTDVYGSGRLHVAFSALCIGVAATVSSWLLKRTACAGLVLGGMFWWVAAAAATALLMPGASYIFLWPPLFALLGLLWAPLAAGALFIALPPVISFFGAFRPELAAFPVVVLALLFMLLLPLYQLVHRVTRSCLPVAALVAFAICFTGAWRAAGPDAGRPMPDNLNYGYEDDSGRAYWFSTDTAPDQWTRLKLGPHPSRGALPDLLRGGPASVLYAEAEGPPPDPPVIDGLRVTSGPDGRFAVFHVRSPRKAPILSLFLPAEARLRQVTVNGRLFDWQPPSGSPAGVHLLDLRSGGSAVQLHYDASAPWHLLVVDRSYGTSASPRPPELMENPRAADVTLASQSFEIR